MELTNKTINIIDKAIVIDTVQYTPKFTLPENVTAIQWHKTFGYIEYDNKEPVRVTNLDGYQDILGLWEAENQKELDEKQVQEEFTDSLDGQKQAKLQAISTRAKTELDKGFTYEGKTYRISADSLSDMQRKEIDGEDCCWTANDYTTKDFETIISFTQFAHACYKANEAIQQNKLRLKGLVTQAKDIDTLNMIDIEEGWT